VIPARFAVDRCLRRPASTPAAFGIPALSDIVSRGIGGAPPANDAASPSPINLTDRAAAPVQPFRPAPLRRRHQRRLQ
jgi:hypothetical protein